MPRAKKTEETKPVAKKKAPVRKSITKADTQVIKPTNDIDKFPHETFPYRLEHQEVKGKKVCWFSHESHVHKYIERHKLVKNTYIAECFSNLY